MNTVSNELFASLHHPWASSFASAPVANDPVQPAGRMTTAKNARMMAGEKGDKRLMHVRLTLKPSAFSDKLASALPRLDRSLRVARVNGKARFDLPSAADPHVIVADLDSCSESAATKRVRSLVKRHPHAAVVTISQRAKEGFITAVLDAGARAFIPKSYSEQQILDVLHLVHHGGTYRPHLPHISAPSLDDTAGKDFVTVEALALEYRLTERQVQAVALLPSGMSNNEIAKHLRIQEGTTKQHLNAAYKKLGVENRAQASHIVQRFSHLSEADLGRIEAGAATLSWLIPYMSAEKHRKGDVIFHKGDPGRDLYYIQRGRVRLPEIGKEMGEGEMFGEIALFSPGQARTCTACCESDTRLLRLTARQVKRLYLENPEFSLYITYLIVRRLIEDRSRAH